MRPGDQLRVAHVSGLGAIALWLAWAHPGGWLPAVLIAVITAAGELLPRGAWRELGTPTLALGAAAATWALGALERGAVHALLGTLVAALLLIPARPGVLRLIAPLCVLELVVLGLPGIQGPSPWLAAVVLAPLACLALATDAWLGARLGARAVAGRGRWPWLPWALVPAVIAGLLGAAAYAPANALAQTLRPGPLRDQAARSTAATPTTARRPPGEAVGIDAGGPPPRDPAPAARLFLPSDPRGLVYLRLAACSRLQRDVATGRLRWLPAPGEVELPDAPTPPPGRVADLVRLGGLGDAVLLPDDGDWAGLPGQFLDGDGNRWRPELGEAIRSYPVALDAPQRSEPEADRAVAAAACRELPPAVAAWPWAEVEKPAWRDQPPLAAAEQIAAALRARCAYDLEPPAAASEPFATFLFGEARDRRGTCEHFAGAAALLLRRAGHPARLVAGFASAEWDGSGVVFRRLHAHAWVEVLDAGGTWQRVDPTPPVAHDLLPRGADLSAALPDPAAAVPLTSPRRSGLSLWLLLLAGLPVLAALFWLGRRLPRPSPAASRQAVYRRRGQELVELAQRLGVRVERHDTAATICQRITARSGLQLGPALAAYEAARFGNGPPPPPWPQPEARRPSPATG